MKLYKFRSLNVDDFDGRIKPLLEWEFWFSKFRALNDILEWIYYSSRIDIKQIKKIFNWKSNYSILSLSWAEALYNSLMRWHYTGWFKWIAIEIEVDIELEDVYEKKIELIKKCEDTSEVTKEWHIRIIKYWHPVDYNDDKDFKVRKILSSKTDAWSYEHEYRIFVDWEKWNYKIWTWTVTWIYFWEPYQKFDYMKTHINDCPEFKKYNDLKWKIIDFIYNNSSYSWIKIYNLVHNERWDIDFQETLSS